MAICSGFAVEVEGDCVCLKTVEAFDAERSRPKHVDGVVAPFAIFGPTDVKLVKGRGNQIGVVEVGAIFNEGNIYTFGLSEMPNVFAGMRPLVPGFEVEFAAAVVNRIGVMIGNAFTTEVEECTLDDSGNVWRTGLVIIVSERFALVIRRQRGRAGQGGRQGHQQHGDSEGH